VQYAKIEIYNIQGKKVLFLNESNISYATLDGCYGSETCSEEEVIYTATNDIESEKDKVIIFPNPSGNEIVIAFDEYRSGLCSIFDIDGRKVYEVRFDGQKNVKVDVAGFVRGSYFIKFINEDFGQIIVNKFVKI
jgi:hypothetical protein